MKAVTERKALTAGRLLAIRREICAQGWDPAEQGLRCNAQVLAETCFAEGEPVFADGEAVINQLTVKEIEALLGRLPEGRSSESIPPAAINPRFSEEQFYRLRGERK